MCRIIRNKIWGYFLLSLYILITGCLPGYEISIETYNIRKDNLIVIKKCIERMGYTENQRTEEQKEDTMGFFNAISFYYHKNISKEPYEYIDVWLFYEIELNKFSITVVNTHIGGNIKPEFRKHIDEEADKIYEELSKIVGKENITIKRETTMPAF